MVAHEPLPQSTSVAHREQSVGIHEPVGLNAETLRFTAEIRSAVLLVDLIEVHQAALATNKPDTFHVLGRTRRNRIMYGLLQIRLHGIE